MSTLGKWALRLPCWHRTRLSGFTRCCMEAIDFQRWESVSVWNMSHFLIVSAWQQIIDKEEAFLVKITSWSWSPCPVEAIIVPVLFQALLQRCVDQTSLPVMNAQSFRERKILLSDASAFWASVLSASVPPTRLSPPSWAFDLRVWHFLILHFHLL